MRWTPTAWIAFLDAATGGNSEAVEFLQEWFGYVLSNDTSQRRMLMLVGPPRSGKSEICQRLEDLLGDRAGSGYLPKSRFLLDSLVGRRLHVVAGTPDQWMQEAMLSIVRGDTLTISQKNKPVRSAVLQTQFAILSQGDFEPRPSFMSQTTTIELKHVDSSVVDVDRLLRESQSELQGIYEWACEGYFRLQSRGKFTVCDQTCDQHATD